MTVLNLDSISWRSVTLGRSWTKWTQLLRKGAQAELTWPTTTVMNRATCSMGPLTRWHNIFYKRTITESQNPTQKSFCKQIGWERTNHKVCNVCGATMPFWHWAVPQTGGAHISSLDSCCFSPLPCILCWLLIPVWEGLNPTELNLQPWLNSEFNVQQAGWDEHHLWEGSPLPGF